MTSKEAIEASSITISLDATLESVKSSIAKGSWEDASQELSYFFCHNPQDKLFFSDPAISSNELVALSLLRYVVKYIEKTKAKLIFLSYPEVFRIKNPNSIEQQIIDGLITVKTLTTLPNHFREQHKSLSYANDDYLKNILIIPNLVYTQGSYRNVDFKSPYVNYINGQRYTVGQPEQYQNKVLFFGNSFIRGANVEDRFTIPSILQGLFNENGLQLKVVNCGVTGFYFFGNIFELFKKTEFTEGDYVIFILNFCQQSYLTNFCAMNGIFYYDFVNDFHRPHEYGTIYTDNHLGFSGNIIIANKIYDMCFSSLQQAHAKLLDSVHSFVDIIENKNVHGLADVQNGKAYDDSNIYDSVEKLYDNIPVFGEGISGAIVMNCNPFTRGHLHIITTASNVVHHLYVFVVQEDKSFFSFNDRFSMVKKGCSHLKNVIVVPSGEFILSSLTLPEYFDKDQRQQELIDSTADIEIFGKYIAKKLNITIRFVGEEPFCKVTNQYNSEMKIILPRYNVKLIEIPRLKNQERPISASNVRKLYSNNEFEKIKELVPLSTFEFLVNAYPKFK